MSASVRFTTDAATAHAGARELLTARPVRNTLPLSLLEERVRHPEPGRYWIAENARGAIGFAMQSPLTNPALLTAMPGSAARVLARNAHAGGFALPGVTADVRTAASFAAEWAEATKLPATVTRAMRFYEARRVVRAGEPAGRFRQATYADRPLLTKWGRAFAVEGNAPDPNIDVVIESRISNGNLWVWDDAGPVSMAAVSIPAAGVVRMMLVYTPVALRERGYARACVGALTQRILGDGLRCTLYADLANPTANGIYRRIGYRPVIEVLTFGFGVTE